MISGAVIDPMQVFFAEDLDYAVAEGQQIGFTSIYRPQEKPDAPWAGFAYPDTVLASNCCWTATASGTTFRCVLGEEGMVNLYGPGGNPDRTFQIPEAGVFREGAAGYGYVSRIRAIGQSLYVCGASRQVYRYVSALGGAPLSGRFVDVAGAMRQPPLAPPPQASGPAFDAWSARDIVLFNDIGGSSESDLYAVGDETWHFDGSAWRQIQLGNDPETMHVVKALDARRVLIGGRNAYLYMGNARDGFSSLVGADDNATITGLEWFDDKLFVATDRGLYTLDAQARRLAPVQTGLQPELQDAHLLEAKDGVLWSFGYKDLAYWDLREGRRGWVRVQHPDNPPVGSPKPARSSRAQPPTPSAAETAQAQAQTARSFAAWQPPRGNSAVDLAGLIARTGHKGVGAYVCEQLAPLGLQPEAVLQFARTQRYELPVPGLGLTLKLQYVGRKVALADAHANPHLWALAGLELQSQALEPGAGWQGPWPGELQPLQPGWAAHADAVWGEPGFKSRTAQTHFIPGARGAALALMLIHESGPALERLRIECMGEYVAG